MFYTNTCSLSSTGLRHDLGRRPDQAREPRDDVEGIDTGAELDVRFEPRRAVRPRVQSLERVRERAREQLGRNGRVRSGRVVQAGDDPSGAVGIVEGEGALEPGAEDRNVVGDGGGDGCEIEQRTEEHRLAP